MTKITEASIAEPLEINDIRLEANDLRSLRVRHWGDSARWSQIAAFAPWMGVVAVLMLLSESRVDRAVSASIFSLVLLAAIAGFVASRLAYSAHLKARLGSRRGQSPYTVTVGPGGFAWHSEFGSVNASWEDVPIIGEDSRRFFYGETIAGIVVVPKRCMANDDVARLRRMIRNFRPRKPRT